MPSPKSKRTAPTQDFDKYVFTRIVGPGTGLFPIASSQMKFFPPTTNTSTGGWNDSYSETMPIGFDFKFNEKIYDKFVVSTNGYLILRQKLDTVAFDYTDYITLPYDNGSIEDWFQRAGLQYPGILLCPWFQDLVNAYTSVDQLYDLGEITADQMRRIKEGIDLPPTSLDPAKSSLRYINTIDKNGSKCLVVRWRSFSTWYASLNSVITFETAIYESGKIEFRYDTRETISSILANASEEGATIGFFLNDDAESAVKPFGKGWRFRDLSIGLGHPKDSTRKISKYGGAEYDSTYLDTRYSSALLSSITAPYNLSMFITNVDNATVTGAVPAVLKNRIANWPGQERFGCIFSFTPPENRRRVLPKMELQKRDSRITLPTVSRTGTNYPQSSRLYDDRKSLVYGTNVIVDFPTTLPRGYTIDNSDTFVRDRINLYADFEVTGNITKAGTESFLQNSVIYTTPFSDHNRPEQAESALNDSYYLTGSNVDQFGLGFSSPLRSKTQIKLELPINHELTMFDVTSSIYYYNNSAKGFFIPQIGNAKSDLANALASINTASIGNWIGWTSEDARGFGPIGNSISSGSNKDSQGKGWTSDSNWGTGSYWFINESTEKLTKLYEKSVQNNSDYFANSNEQITIPINQPFLLEKAVFEIPIKAGEGWFNDRTTTSTPTGWNPPSTLSSIQQGLARLPDFAGPAITLALYNQVTTENVTHRDLILTGTIIPKNDNVRNIKVRTTAMTSSTGTGYTSWLLEPEGFLSYNSTPGAVVSPNINNQFTGSIVLPTIAGISNGFNISYYYTATSISPPYYYNDWASDVIDLMTKETITISTASLNKSGKSNSVAYIANINPFGRNSKGFDPSGRSYFGKEHVTYQSLGTTVKNPLYVSSSFSEFPSYIKNVLDTSVNPVFRSLSHFYVPVAATYDSPYLLLPGDKLTLAISKMRPVMHTLGTDPSNPNNKVDYWRSGSKHDICITTGSIKVTLYGSLIKEDKEFHDTLNQPLASDAIHELIGAEPVLDQFEVEYKDSFFGSYTDDYITGSLVSLGTNSTIKVGSRGRVFNKLNARNQPTPDTSAYELEANSSKAFRLQPWYERVGDLRIVHAVNSAERFYDSMMPDFQSCMKKDDASISWVTDITDMFASSADVQTNKKYGTVLFDMVTDYSTLSISASLLNNKWTFAYPFEPRYSGVSRQLSYNKEIIVDTSTKDLFDSTNHTVTSINRRKINELLLGRFNRPFGDASSQGTFDFVCDVNLYNDTTASLSSDDFGKYLFGFGDVNTRTFYTSGGNTYWYGNNHQPEFRNKDIYVAGGIPRSYSFGPVIRGWKYGVYNGLPTFNKVIFRRNKYGQFRDMLEQRLDSKFFQTEITEENPNIGVLESPILIKFVDSEGKITSPENTWSQNLSFEVTSSMPYFDGLIKNRNEPDVNLNQSILNIL